MRQTKRMETQDDTANTGKTSTLMSHVSKDASDTSSEHTRVTEQSVGANAAKDSNHHLNTLDVDFEDEDEGFWANPLFLALQERVANFEQQASELAWYILVPIASSLVNENRKPLQLSMDLLRKHVVHASPYLRGEHVNFSGDRIILEKGLVTVVRQGSDPTPTDKYRIVAEESCFGGSGSYKVLVIDRPIITKQLDSYLPPETVSFFPEDGTPVFDETRSVDDWMFVLNRDRNNSAALRKLEEFTENFRHNYVLVANKVGIDDFARKMNVNIESTLDNLVIKNRVRFGLAASNKRFRAMLRRAVEAFAFLGVHDMVFGALVNCYSSQEQYIFAKLAQHKDNLDSSAERSSVQFFEDLNRQRCPLAKLEFIRDYLRVSSVNGDFTLNADNILSTFVNRLANLPSSSVGAVHVLANLQYMQVFHASPIPNDLHYLLYQFRAAICYLTGIDDLEDLSLSPQILSQPTISSFLAPSYQVKITKTQPTSGRSPQQTFSTDAQDLPTLDSFTRGGARIHKLEDGKQNVKPSTLVLGKSSAKPTAKAGWHPVQNDAEEAVSERDSDDESDDGSDTESTAPPKPGLGDFLTALMQSDADVVSSSH